MSTPRYQRRPDPAEALATLCPGCDRTYRGPLCPRCNPIVVRNGDGRVVGTRHGSGRRCEDAPCCGCCRGV